jgi:trehalose synthase
VTTLEIERFPAPETSRKARMVELMRLRAAEQLEGKSVWCVAVVPGEAAAADALVDCLVDMPEIAVAPRRATLEPGQPLIGLLTRLDAMLRGAMTVASSLGPDDEDVYAMGSQQADALIPGGVRAGDVVILHDPIAAALAPAIRERGAHALWQPSIGCWEASTLAAWRFLHRTRPVLDAYVTGWRSARPLSHGRTAVAAYISSRRVLAAKEAQVATPNHPGESLVWTTALGDVVMDDRIERVGGKLHARPSIPAH